MEILDLIAKISWDTNSKELDTLNRKLGEENKLLEELRNKGRNLEAQMLKTNDPKKVAEYNKQLQAVRKSADAITDSQKKQVEVSKQLVTQQQKLHTELRKTNDPNQVKGLLQGLYKVENQMSVLTTKATTMGAKFGGIGQSLLQGFGIGGGAAIGAMALTGISSFFQSALSEAAEAEQGLLKFKQSLENIGQGGLFDKLVSQADQLAGTYKNLFDNDDILAGQAKFIEGTRVSEEQLSKLIPVAVELAAKLGTDVTTASEMLVNAIIGRTSPELKRLGLDMKGLGSQTERVNEITGDFATLLSGSVDTALQTTSGQAKQLKQEIANIQEEIGTKMLPLQKVWNGMKLAFLKDINELMGYEEDLFKPKLDEAKQRFSVMTDEEVKLQKKNINASIKDAKLYQDKITELRLENESAFITRSKFNANEQAIKSYTELFDKEIAKQTALGQLLINQKYGTSKKGPINNNAGQDEEVPMPKAIVPSKPIVVEPKKIVIDVQSADVLFKDGDATVPNLKSDEIKVAPVTKIENTPEFQNAESQRDLERKQKNEQKIKDDEELARQERMDLYNSTIDLARAAQDQLRIEEDKTNRLIALQEKRVEAARNQSSESLKVEQDRLNELLKKRQQYERAQRVIDAAVITSNQALAISGAIATIANSKNPVLIAANVIAILAGIGAVIGSIRSINASEEGFKEGGYTGDGDPGSESTAIGKRPYKYHKKEFVMNEELTRKHRDLFDGLHNKDLVVNKLDDGKWYITQNGLDNNAMVNDHYSVKNDMSMMPLLMEMQGIRSLLKQREVKVENNFDADGFGMAVATQMGGITLKNKRRQW
jgi:hypothetical protein